jgi:MFS transporter, DHA2 family, multidrug resistance protein
MPSQAEPQLAHRGLITICAMAATLMQALDSTIANVALPYMQGSLAASADQITWVLTSYIVAAAIMTAPIGWLSNRFGQKNVFMVSLIGFTITSMLCGIAGSLTEIVVFRLLQGIFGAALVPLSQSTMLEIYPPEQRSSAMAIWSIGVMIGPILGPTLGGYLTEFYDWRFVFFVNVPFGALATVGLGALLPRTAPKSGLRFDWTGFALLAVGLAGLQLMLDRGETRDWFGSKEIIIEATMAALGLYLFAVHMCTAERPFITARIFKDRNLTIGLVVMFMVGLVLLAVSALLAPWLQELANYPVEAAGLAMAPRGIGTMAAMVVAGRVMNRVDGRLLMAIGVVILAWSLWRMAGWTPAVSEQEVVVNAIVQGAGFGFAFLPLQVIAFATLEPALRTEGTALLSLSRNIGMAIGVSVSEALLDQNMQVEHSVLTGYVSPLHHMLGVRMPNLTSPATHLGAQAMNALINQQSLIIAYDDDFKLMVLTTIPILLLLPLLRRSRSAPAGHSAVMD